MEINFKTSITEDGLRICTSYMPQTKSVSIAFYVGAGSRYETIEESGISHFVEHMLFKGTPSHSTPKEISETIEGIGGVMNAATDRELTTYWCKVPATHFDVALDLLTDMIKNSLFDPVEIEKERQVILEELAMTYDNPSFIAELLIDEIMWPNHPLGRDVGGTKESVGAITRPMLIDYFNSQYTCPNIVISIAGDLHHDEAVSTLSNHFKDWKKGKPRKWTSMEESQEYPRFKITQKKTEQAQICVGLKGLPSDHKDRYGLSLLSTILGDGMSSRLFVELREKQGIAYDVHTTVSHLMDCGSLITYAGVDPVNTSAAIDGILAEMRKMKRGIPDDEINKAKEFLKGRLILRLEDSRSMAAWIGAQELILDQIIPLEEVLKQVNAVTADDLLRIANDLIITEKLSVAVVGRYKPEKAFLKNLTL